MATLIRQDNSTILPAQTEGNVGIMYGKSNSENFGVYQYTGTGAAGNFVETKDVYGVARKPRRVIIKAVSTSGDWIVYDSERLTSSENIELNTNNAELVNSGYNITLDTYGITINGTTGAINASGEQYIALVEFDTNSNGGDGYFNMPTDDSNLNLTDGVFSYTDGKDSNGYVRSTESLAGTTTIDFAGISDGKHWVAKAKDGGYGFYKGLSNGLYNKEHADDNRLVFNPDDGKVYNTTGGELVTNGTFEENINDGDWQALTGCSIEWSSGSLKATRTSDSDDRAFVTTISNATIGEKYVFQFTLSLDTATGTSFYINQEMQNTFTVNGVYTILYTPTTSDAELKWFIQGDTDSVLYIDDVSVYKLEATPDQPIEPISFLPNPIMVASETPQYIDYSEELATNVMDSLEVSKNITAGSLEVGKLSVAAGFDLGQKWVNETANRALGVTYTNTTGKPIMISINAYVGQIIIYVDGILTAYSNSGPSDDRNNEVTVVPAGSTYLVLTADLETLTNWAELK